MNRNRRTRRVTPADSFSNPFDRDNVVATELRFVMKHITLCIALFAAGSVISLSSCDSRDDASAARAARSSQPAPDRGTSTTPPDNTGSNRDDVGRTPLDQSETREHVKLTADIRQAIVEDDTLSMTATNCKIITDKSGRVWLRGVVDSQAEKDLIEQIAMQIAGANTVMNELEVKDA